MNALNEKIDLSPRCDVALIATRGAVYAALIAAGETDFIAAQTAFNAQPATREGVAIGADLIAVWWGGATHPCQIAAMAA